MRICPICHCQIKQLIEIEKIELTLIDNIMLNNTLNVKLCTECNFYFSDSNNTQEDYNNYYLTYNNYQQQTYCLDKDTRGAEFICKNMNTNEIKTIIDYGSGNGTLSKILSEHFLVDQFDIGMEINTKKYDCLIISHVLEHIYDLNNFIYEISKNIKDDGVLYIEIPNAEYYDKIINICPLQEINVEHINFFSKYALNKLLINNGFYCIQLQDDYFILKSSKYYVIRGIFKKTFNNKSLETYINAGVTLINSYNFENLKKYKSIYIYGCGQFLFKIFDKIQQYCLIINIIDDNLCYSNKKINNIAIINYDTFKKRCNDGDNILLTTLIHDSQIKQKLLLIEKNINIIIL
jgi:hypothetical protein